jgi:hypothetical protein
LLYLDFHHHTILVRCNESELLKKLQDEFHFFVKDNFSTPEVTIDLILETPPELPSMVASKILETATVYHLGSRQYIDYAQEALTIWERFDNKVEIFCLNQERLYELAFLAIHSLLGQQLDRDGICRLHAVAISIGHTNAIIVLPSKGGKSTLLEFFLQNPEVKIISDDMPLCDIQGRIFPFPSKISLNALPEKGPLSKLNWNEFVRTSYPPKWTASLAQMKERIELNSEKNHNILIAGLRLSSGQSLLLKVSKWKMIRPMLEHMIMGFGLPQVLEMFLSFKLTDILKLPYHAAIRTICAFQLVRKADCYYVYLGPDKELNSQIILDTIYESFKE